MADDDIDWKGPSSGTKWIRPSKSHLRDGGFSDLRDSDGLTARVAGEAGRIPPRTGEDGVVLKVSLHPFTPETS